MSSCSSLIKLYTAGSTKTWNPESGNGNGITETETEYGIRERRFQAIDLKKNVSNDNKITQQIKKKKKKRHR